MNLDAGIREEIIGFAQTWKSRKVMLFGSRARGDNTDRSAMALAVSGGDITEFRLAVDDEIRTLLMFDVVNLDGPVPKTLSDSIEKEGIILYEKI